MPLLQPAYRLALGMVLDPHLAEDVVQDAALQAWRRRDNRRAGTALRPWFLGIVANQCRTTRRSRWARVLLLNTAVDSPYTDGDAAQRLAVRQALLALPHRKRLAVVLRCYLDLPFEQVASSLGCSENAAKLRVARAFEDLRRSLSDVRS